MTSGTFAHAPQPDMLRAGDVEMAHARLIAIAGAIALTMVAMPAFVRHAGTIPLELRWIVALASFVGFFAAGLRRRRFSVLLAQTAAVIALVFLRCGGYEGALLAVIAMQLGTHAGWKVGSTWIVVQTALLVAAVALELGPRAAWLLAPPYLALQVVAYLTFRVMAREAVARMASGRMAERLRIAHELHDALGHRLTALTLNLEALLQRLHGPERATAALAQSLARQLLRDVREIVAGPPAIDAGRLTRALRDMARTVPKPTVHLEIGAELCIADPEPAHILLRCAQEIVTNAVRHSGAENLWMVVERDGDTLRIRARDDGRGSHGMVDGFGLRGMRDRVERAGGELRIDTQPDGGFDVTARVPVRARAA